MFQTQSDQVVLLSSERSPSVALTYLSSLPSEVSRYTMENALKQVVHLLGADDIWSYPFELLKYQDLAAIQARLMQDHAPASVRHYLTAVKGCIHAAYVLGLMSVEDYVRSKELKGVRGDSRSGQCASEADILAILNTCRVGPPTRACRDAAMIHLLAGLGMRCSEVLRLRFSDWDPSDGSLTYMGKGRHIRTNWLGQGARQALEAWIKIRGTGGPDFMFLTVVPGDQLVPRPISRSSTLWRMLNRRAKAAGVRHYGVHDFRRTACTHMLEKGFDPLTVGGVLGHTSGIAVTGLYDKRSNDTMKAAVAAVGLPYSRPLVEQSMAPV
jgi:integrase/recombinase XerD